MLIENLTLTYYPGNHDSHRTFSPFFTVTWKRLVSPWLGHRRRSSVALKLWKHNQRMVQFQCEGLFLEGSGVCGRCSVTLQTDEILVEVPSPIRHSCMSTNALKWDLKTLYFPISFSELVGGCILFCNWFFILVDGIN